MSSRFIFIPSPCQPISKTFREETTVFWVFVDVRPTFTHSWPPVSPWFDAHGSRWTCRATVPSVLVSHTNPSPASLPSSLYLSLNVMDSVTLRLNKSPCLRCLLGFLKTGRHGYMMGEDPSYSESNEGKWQPSSVRVSISALCLS